MDGTLCTADDMIRVYSMVGSVVPSNSQNASRKKNALRSTQQKFRESDSSNGRNLRRAAKDYYIR